MLLDPTVTLISDSWLSVSTCNDIDIGRLQSSSESTDDLMNFRNLQNTPAEISFISFL